MSTAEMINHELAACWEMCCEAVGIDTDATAAEWREEYEAKRAQVRREAAVKALREAADEWTQGKLSEVPRMADRLHERIETANYVGNFLRARADWMETEK